MIQLVFKIAKLVKAMLFRDTLFIVRYLIFWKKNSLPNSGLRVTLSTWIPSILTFLKKWVLMILYKILCWTRTFHCMKNLYMSNFEGCLLLSLIMWRVSQIENCSYKCFWILHFWVCIYEFESKIDHILREIQFSFGRSSRLSYQWSFHQLRKLVVPRPEMIKQDLL